MLHQWKVGSEKQPITFCLSQAFALKCRKMYNIVNIFVPPHRKNNLINAEDTPF